MQSSNNKEEWKVLNIPMIAEKKEDIQYGNFYYQRQHGEYLHVERDGEAEIENNYFDNFFKNIDSIKSLKVIKVNNLDLKYSSNKNSIEISDINSDIIFDKGSVKRFDLKGNFFNLPFTSKFQGAKNKDKSIGNLSIQSNDLKFYLPILFASLVW